MSELTYESLTHECKGILVLMLGVERLIELGLATGGSRLSPEGRQMALRLEAEGFKPTPEEINAFISTTFGHPDGTRQTPGDVH